MDVRRNLRLAAKSDHTWLHQPAATSSPIPDHVLLCCFGPELAGARHHKQLSAALQQAGYRGALAQHLIRSVHCSFASPVATTASSAATSLVPDLAPLEPAPAAQGVSRRASPAVTPVRAPPTTLSCARSVLALAAGVLMPVGLFDRVRARRWPPRRPPRRPPSPPPRPQRQRRRPQWPGHSRRSGLDTYEVGTGNGQIAPGKYFAPPRPASPPCYYARRPHRRRPRAGGGTGAAGFPGDSAPSPAVLTTGDRLTTSCERRIPPRRFRCPAARCPGSARTRWRPPATQPRRAPSGQE